MGNMKGQAKHVFLSYCHDNVQEVTRLRDDLINAGEQVWWNKDILPGKEWKNAIRVAMKQSYAVVLCLSKESEARFASGIYPEVLDAIAQYRQLAPGGVFLSGFRTDAEHAAGR
jgi:TIR domain